MGRRIIPILIVGFFVLGLYLFVSFAGLFDGDAMEYAEIGRNIAEGKGFYTNSIFPLRLQFSHEYPFPSLRRPPLFPLALASFFSIFGSSDLTVVMVAGIFLLLTVPIIYVLSYRLFLREDVAILASLFYVFNNNALFYAVNGLTEPLFAFLFTVFLLFIFKAGSEKDIFFAGLILGLAQLTRPNAVIYFMPSVAYILIITERRKKVFNAAVFSLGFLVPVSYILIYNLKHTGSPFFSLFKYLLLETTPQYSGYVVQRSLEAPDVWAYVISHPRVYIARNFQYLVNQYRTFYRLIGPLLTAFFVVSILRWHPDREIRRFRLFFYSLFLIQILFSSVALGDIRYCFHFIPVMLVFTSEQICRSLSELSPVTDRFRYSRMLIVSALFVVAISPFGIQSVRAFKSKFVEHKNPQAFIPDHPIGAYDETGKMIRRWIKEGDLVLSDAGWVVSWYGKRIGLRIPMEYKDLELIEKGYGIKAQNILLTSDLLYRHDSDPLWESFLKEEKAPAEFNIVEKIEKPGYKAVLYKKSAIE